VFFASVGLSKSNIEKMEAKRDVTGLIKELTNKDALIRLSAVGALRRLAMPEL
jgi:hypothetical protein